MTGGADLWGGPGVLPNVAPDKLSCIASGLPPGQGRWGRRQDMTVSEQVAIKQVAQASRRCSRRL